MICDNIDKIGNVIMSVSSFLRQRIVKNVDDYDLFILGNEVKIEQIKDKIPPQFIQRHIYNMDTDKLVVLFGNEENSIYGIINIKD
jgi:hypothetical protein